MFDELGRFPISYKCLGLCVKYWHRLATGASPNVLLNCAYMSQSQNNSSWLQSIKYLLTVNGLAYMWENPYIVSTAIIYNKFQLRLNDQFIQTWFNKASTSPNLSVINLMKTSYEFSDYLNKVKSPKMRTIYTKLRFNERLIKNSLHANDPHYKCPMCNTNETESVQHFLLYCPHYNVHRDKLLGIFSRKSSKFNILSPCDKIRVLLNLQTELLSIKKDTDHDENDVYCAIISFIKDISLTRESPPERVGLAG